MSNILAETLNSKDSWTQGLNILHSTSTGASFPTVPFLCSRLFYPSGNQASYSQPTSCHLQLSPMNVPLFQQYHPQSLASCALVFWIRFDTTESARSDPHRSALIQWLCTYPIALHIFGLPALQVLRLLSQYGILQFHKEPSRSLNLGSPERKSGEKSEHFFT